MDVFASSTSISIAEDEETFRRFGVGEGDLSLNFPFREGFSISDAELTRRGPDGSNTDNEGDDSRNLELDGADG